MIVCIFPKKLTHFFWSLETPFFTFLLAVESPILMDRIRAISYERPILPSLERYLLQKSSKGTVPAICIPFGRPIFLWRNKWPSQAHL